ncbi:hypothetical protein TSAR_012278 [Trichomalopsis sarcophagae]|uniref:C2H2-type domain-containing protein n=1 Tax=Trichomalopsis sarcophagae TaxID=543379 RepID=A0A232FNQ6_9HYME|nr:hypothetical protein TSAR_012278 [Trichomalopsis sarcophagae]
MKLHTTHKRHTADFGKEANINVDLGLSHIDFCCLQCERRYSSLAALKFHQKYECGVEPSYVCPFCSYKTRRKYLLSQHLFRHTKQKSYVSLNYL